MDAPTINRCSVSAGWFLPWYVFCHNVNGNANKNSLFYICNSIQNCPFTDSTKFFYFVQVILCDMQNKLSYRKYSLCNNLFFISLFSERNKIPRAENRPLWSGACLMEKSMPNDKGHVLPVKPLLQWEYNENTLFFFCFFLFFVCLRVLPVYDCSRLCSPGKSP